MRRPLNFTEGFPAVSLTCNRGSVKKGELQWPIGPVTCLFSILPALVLPALESMDLKVNALRQDARP